MQNTENGGVTEKKSVFKRFDDFLPKAVNKKFFYGWIVFAACFLSVMFCMGFGSSTKSIYTKIVTTQLHIPRSLFTVNDSMRYIATAIISFFFGPLVARFGTRKMLGAGFMCLICSFTIYSFATTYWHFWIGGAFLGLGLAGTTTNIVGHIVEKWFTNGKGTIMGLILAANGLGGLVSEFVINKILFGWDMSLTEETARWQLGYRVTVLIFAVVGIIAFALIRNEPRDLGIKPWGEDKVKKKKRGADWDGYDLKTILRKPYFYIGIVCVFFIGFTLQAMVSASKPHMYDVGLEKSYVMTVFMWHSAALAFAKVLSGISFDKFGIRVTFAGCCFFSFIAIGSLIFLTPDSVVLPWVYSFISAFALPLETVMVPLLVMQMFGHRSYSTVMGYYLASTTMGFAVGVPVVNLFYDMQKTYKYIFIVFVCILALVTVFIQIAMAKSEKDRLEFLEKEKEKIN